MKKITEGNLKIEHLHKQEQHWENMFSSRSEMFGAAPSVAAIKSVETFKKEKLASRLYDPQEMLGRWKTETQHLLL